MADPIRVLVVDDAVEYAEMVAMLIRSEASPGAHVELATDSRTATRSLAEHPFDLAFFDYWLGADDGLSLLRQIRARGIGTPVILMTGRGDEEVAVEAMKAGAADYLVKSAIDGGTLGAAIRHTLALAAQRREQRQAEERFRALVENSSDALLLLDADGRITYTSASSERHL